LCDDDAVSVSPDVLADVPFFALLREEERAALAGRLEIKTAPAGETLFNYGDPGDSLYILRGGEVEIFYKNDLGERVLLETLGAGDFFGELSLLDGGPRTASAVVTREMHAVTVDREDLSAFLQQHPEAAIPLLAASGRRLRESSERGRRSAAVDINEEQADRRSRAMKIADWISSHVGSLPFLGANCGLLVVWIALNLGPLGRTSIGGWDPFPFRVLTISLIVEAILLLLFLLFGQGRQAARERIRNDIEHRVNLRNELELGHMHQKVDQLRAEMLERFVDLKSPPGPRPPKP
jgi:CRP-like cAMP-binding protein